MSKVQFLLLDKNLITDTNISDKEYRIYTYLLYLYNAEKKGSYPSLETISNALNISVTTVKKSIKNLVNLGYMKIEKEKIREIVIISLEENEISLIRIKGKIDPNQMQNIIEDNA